MKPVKMPKPKYHYYGMINGNFIGETWAVPDAKARANLWWIFVKGCDEFAARDYDPEDIDLVVK